ncbi:hypothetical protein PA7_42370 [Pseudonocardia asaccharolytica DSM 44247 = NBRC 16224]|uniref:ANTAR domain-containing protein n=1 Tax=Pseudonocardia asaccharolytica DSM 44247 = NBRC 16224 TaxID=1123024 RepID=A0A511D6I3_9PSEU|nr:hypothetical protein PA7_42370 [Pseudonocardia asaccharolytica DSM 44247 = NBRC 16224]
MPETPVSGPASEPGDIALDLLRRLLVADGIEEFLTDAARLVVGVVATADACGVTLRLTPDAPTRAGDSDEFARRVDAIQHDLGEGPVPTCLRDAMPVELTDIEADPRWPRFSRWARAEGLGGVLSTPLVIGSRPLGAISLYARVPHAFTAADRHRMHWLADPLAVAIAVAVRLAERAERNRNLEIALTSRATVDQALGILMDRYRVNAQEAFQLLRRRSQHTNVKLRDVAAALVAAVSQTRPRAGRPDP